MRDPAKDPEGKGSLKELPCLQVRFLTLKKENPAFLELLIIFWLCAKPWGSRDEGLWCFSWRNSLARQGTDTQGKGSVGDRTMQHCKVKLDGGIGINEAKRLDRAL